MRRTVHSILACLTLVAGCTAVPPRASIADLQKQVADAERGFAKTMAERDHAAFTTFISDEAIFFTGAAPLRGKQAVADAWKRFYDKPEAPFSWEPELVEVFDSGTLALSSGPVRDPKGKHFATYSSIWRQEAPGVWRVIFDQGSAVCACAGP